MHHQLSLAHLSVPSASSHSSEVELSRRSSMADIEAWLPDCLASSDCQPESADWGLAGMLLKL